MSSSKDVWFEWLLERRCAGDEAYKRLVQASMEQVRSRVLDGAKLTPGMTLVDVGAGEGLVGFGAIEKIGPALRVVFTDISEALLQHVSQLAAQRGVGAQCAYVHANAERLAGVANASVDAVATRASLAYVPNKVAAFGEFFRVLKPGGCISLAEPVFQDAAFELLAMAKMIQQQPNHPQAEFYRLLHRYRAAQFPSTEQEIWQNPTTNYSDRDLVQLARAAGFADVHLELHIDCRTTRGMSWESYLDISPHPLAPTLRQIFERSFTMEEKRKFEAIQRPLLESGQSVTQEAVAYLTAVKPMLPEKISMPSIMGGAAGV